MLPKKYKLIIEDNWIKIYIKNILHLSFKKDIYLGIQSYIEGYDKKERYYIIIYTKEREIVSNYVNFNDWKQLLKLYNQIKN